MVPFLTKQKAIKFKLAWLLILAGFLAAGCSGPCALYFHNEMGFPIVVHYAYAEQDAPNGIREGDVQLASGETKEESMFFWVTPPSLDIKVSGNASIRHQKFLKAQFPENVRNDPSLSTPFHLYVRPSGMKLDGPNFWERGGIYLILLAIVMVVVVIGLVKSATAKKAKAN